MTPEAQLIAIAEFCGRDMKDVKESLIVFKDRDGYPDAIFQLAKIPNYPADLNAMHEAEKALEGKDGALCLDYVNWVQVIEPGKTKSRYGICHATAAQRAEALLRTIGKWTDE